MPMPARPRERLLHARSIGDPPWILGSPRRTSAIVINFRRCHQASTIRSPRSSRSRRQRSRHVIINNGGARARYRCCPQRSASADPARSVHHLIEAAPNFREEATDDHLGVILGSEVRERDVTRERLIQGRDVLVEISESESNDVIDSLERIAHEVDGLAERSHEASGAFGELHGGASICFSLLGLQFSRSTRVINFVANFSLRISQHDRSRDSRPAISHRSGENASEWPYHGVAATIRGAFPASSSRGARRRRRHARAGVAVGASRRHVQPACHSRWQAFHVLAGTG
jgi:hypothetical protein